MSLLSYAMWFAIAWLCRELGLLEISRAGMAGFGGLLLLNQLLFYLLIRSDINLRFGDPSLTLPQIVTGLAWSLVLIYFAREIRGVLLAVFMVTMLFGIFALSKRQFTRVAIASFVGYIALSAWERQVHPGLFSDGFYIVSTTIMGGVLLWTTLFGSYVSDLRYKLSARNQALEKALTRIRTLAERDDLTGAYNRRYIMEQLRKEMERNLRYDTTFSLIMIDLDHFKQVNDKFGHSAGDKVLTEFTRHISAQLRSIDLVAASDTDPAFGRYGGEEFVIVLPDTSLEGACQAAERLRALQQEQFEQQGTRPYVTLSAGVAEYVPGESIESLLRRADQALYEAKYGGRNQVRKAAIQ